MGALIPPLFGQVYVDANSVIYAVEHIEPYNSLLKPLWEAAHERTVSLITSELTWLEVLTKPLRDRNTQLADLFRDFLFAEEITLVAADISLWEQAAILRGLGLKTPDALHAATALAAQCQLFVTNDPIFLRVPHLPTVVLTEVLKT